MKRKTFLSDAHLFRYWKILTFISFLIVVVSLFFDIILDYSFVENKPINIIRVSSFFLIIILVSNRLFHNKQRIELKDMMISGFNHRTSTREEYKVSEIIGFGLVPEGVIASNLAYKNVDSFYINFDDCRIFEFCPNVETRDKLIFELLSMTDLDETLWEGSK